MIVAPTNTEQWNKLAWFLKSASGTHPSADMKLMGWVSDDKIRAVVGFNNFMGKACFAHFGLEYGYNFTPREGLREAFNYIFKTCGMELVLATVNSKNDESKQYMRHLGFKEMYKIPRMHTDGGDIVLYGMRYKDYKFRHLTNWRVNGAQHPRVAEAH